jgi:hypothetical protein
MPSSSPMRTSRSTSSSGSWAYQPRRHLHLLTGDRQRRDHRHRPRPQGAHDPGQYRTPYRVAGRTPASPSVVGTARGRGAALRTCAAIGRPEQAPGATPVALLRSWDCETLIAGGGPGYPRMNSTSLCAGVSSRAIPCSGQRPTAIARPPWARCRGVTYLRSLSLDRPTADRNRRLARPLESPRRWPWIAASPVGEARGR